MKLFEILNNPKYHRNVTRLRAAPGPGPALARLNTVAVPSYVAIHVEARKAVELRKVCQCTHSALGREPAGSNLKMSVSSLRIDDENETNDTDESPAVD